VSASAVAWVPAFVGLGSNLNDPEQQVERAIEALGRLSGCRLGHRSSLYESNPMGPSDQPQFINAVVSLLTCLSAAELLAHLHTIEDAHYRDRTVARWGPRTLDLDLLLFGNERSDDPEMILPHPGLTDRNFVVYPLAQIAPQLVLPDGTSVAQLVGSLGMTGLRKIKDTGIQ
jgi:2-amino-4-hydroxy-6-hydroxymethyldihydropteridine diphosphokinase